MQARTKQDCRRRAQLFLNGREFSVALEPQAARRCARRLVKRREECHGQDSRDRSARTATEAKRALGRLRREPPAPHRAGGARALSERRQPPRRSLRGETTWAAATARGVSRTRRGVPVALHRQGAGPTRGQLRRQRRPSVTLGARGLDRPPVGGECRMLQERRRRDLASSTSWWCRAARAERPAGGVALDHALHAQGRGGGGARGRGGAPSGDPERRTPDSTERRNADELHHPRRRWRRCLTPVPDTPADHHFI
jgi:hypothetical protein